VRTAAQSVAGATARAGADASASELMQVDLPVINK